MHGIFRQDVPVRYACIRQLERSFSVRRLCQILTVHPSGYYAWRRNPLTIKQQEDQRLIGLIKQSWLESGRVYGYRKITYELRQLGESCGKYRVLRLMHTEGIRSQSGYQKKRTSYGGKPAINIPNHVQQQFVTTQPNITWVTDITYIRTYEGWLYLSIVLDLFSRKVVGWSMGDRITTELAMDALLMAVWRRQPKGSVLIHSDQGTQFTSYQWRDFLKAHHLEPSMSRRGNCYDNAVAESFFQLLKRERIKRKIYINREEAKQDIFNYIEMFYNPVRQHGYNQGLSPVQFEQHYFDRLQSVYNY